MKKIKRSPKMACDKYQGLPGEENDKKREYVGNIY